MDFLNSYTIKELREMYRETSSISIVEHVMNTRPLSDVYLFDNGVTAHAVVNRLLEGSYEMFVFTVQNIQIKDLKILHKIILSSIELMSFNDDRTEHIYTYLSEINLNSRIGIIQKENYDFVKNILISLEEKQKANDDYHEENVFERSELYSYLCDNPSLKEDDIFGIFGFDLEFVKYYISNKPRIIEESMRNICLSKTVPTQKIYSIIETFVRFTNYLLEYQESSSKQLDIDNILAECMNEYILNIDCTCDNFIELWNETPDILQGINSDSIRVELTRLFWYIWRTHQTGIFDYITNILKDNDNYSITDGDYNLLMNYRRDIVRGTSTGLGAALFLKDFFDVYLMDNLITSETREQKEMIQQILRTRDSLAMMNIIDYDFVVDEEATKKSRLLFPKVNLFKENGYEEDLPLLINTDQNSPQSSGYYTGDGNDVTVQINIQDIINSTM